MIRYIINSLENKQYNITVVEGAINKSAKFISYFESNNSYFESISFKIDNKMYTFYNEDIMDYETVGNEMIIYLK